MTETNFNVKECENLTDEQTDELLADILCFAEMFERLSTDDKESMLKFLRQLNNTK